MKQRLIDADELIQRADEDPQFAVWEAGTGTLTRLIDTMPTIDPKSMRPTAHWVKDGDVENPYRGSGTKYHCSACGRRAGYKQRWRYKYCPFCGAKIEDCT